MTLQEEVWSGIKNFFRLLDLTVYNTYIFYRYINKNSIELSSFGLMLIKELSTKFSHEKVAQGRPTADFHKRHVESQFLSSIGGKLK